jgi:cytochrome c oxidase subunit 4
MKTSSRLAAVWGALLALLAATVALAHVRMGAVNVAASFGIAAVKAALVLWFFMELRHDRALVRLVLAVAAVAVLLLLMLGGADYIGRR